MKNAMKHEDNHEIFTGYLIRKVLEEMCAYIL